ncbi:hypothetical protein EPI10_029929 [Gossypium australe]|uniref:Uncharacterized protein n=1 Tax=Gossypium australe TaxID=47621 RepID=A0A5B6WX42_9ROSI|nr:hypothetical protein EPI10_029929 [Gossypium australe]
MVRKPLLRLVWVGGARVRGGYARIRSSVREIAGIFWEILETRVGARGDLKRRAWRAREKPKGARVVTERTEVPEDSRNLWTTSTFENRIGPIGLCYLG